MRLLHISGVVEDFIAIMTFFNSFYSSIHELVLSLELYPGDFDFSEILVHVSFTSHFLCSTYNATWLQFNNTVW